MSNTPKYTQEKILERINNLSEKVFQRKPNPGSIKRMGGMNNHNYEFWIGDTGYTMRLPGIMMDDAAVDRKTEYAFNLLGAELGLDPGLIYFDEKTGDKIGRFVHNAATLNADLMRQPENLTLTASALRKLHQSGVDNGISFNLAQKLYEHEIQMDPNHICLPDFYNQQKRVYKVIELHKQMEYTEVTCHNDPNCENWIKSDSEIFLIDWEYGGMNDPMYDLADLINEAKLNESEIDFLLHEYFGRDATHDERKRVHMCRIMTEYLWSMWSDIRVIYDESLIEYGLWRYGNLLILLASFSRLYQKV